LRKQEKGGLPLSWKKALFTEQQEFASAKGTALHLLLALLEVQRQCCQPVWDINGSDNEREEIEASMENLDQSLRRVLPTHPPGQIQKIHKAFKSKEGRKFWSVYPVSLIDERDLEGQEDNRLTRREELRVEGALDLWKWIYDLSPYEDKHLQYVMKAFSGLVSEINPERLLALWQEESVGSVKEKGMKLIEMIYNGPLSLSRREYFGNVFPKVRIIWRPEFGNYNSGIFMMLDSLRVSFDKEGNPLVLIWDLKTGTNTMSRLEGTIFLKVASEIAEQGIDIREAGQKTQMVYSKNMGEIPERGKVFIVRPEKPYIEEMIIDREEYKENTGILRALMIRGRRYRQEGLLPKRRKRETGKPLPLL